ncbi:lysostaphin resistance A-like protein [Pseudorhodoplanes sp.]|uniref:CPBP family intramembrane glutamic endopeptidase n=1 Tax=Pseudorhodoplanes sp. TaxID=1934341 RepID=UPI003D0A7A5D
MNDTAAEPTDAQPGPCRPWGFWVTTAIGIAAILAWFAFQLLAVSLTLAALGVGSGASDFELMTLASHALTIAVATIVSMPAPIAVIALAARLAGCTVTEYLALRMPTRADLIVGVLIVAVLLPLGDLSSWLSGRDIVPAAVIDAYRSARDSGIVVLLIVALVVAAPLMEEILFRGFLFRGYVNSPLGVAATILLTSAGWAVMHIQYEAFYMVQIFVLGCAFGWLRWRSGSTLLIIFLHALVNAAALTQVAFLVERAGMQ